MFLAGYLTKWRAFLPRFNTLFSAFLPKFWLGMRRNPQVIATRYNRGPNLSLEKIKENLSYGESLYRHQAKINNALNPSNQK